MSCIATIVLETLPSKETLRCLWLGAKWQQGLRGLWAAEGPRNLIVGIL